MGTSVAVAVGVMVRVSVGVAVSKYGPITATTVSATPCCGAGLSVVAMPYPTNPATIVMTETRNMGQSVTLRAGTTILLVPTRGFEPPLICF